MAISRDIMNKRSVPGTSMGPAGRGSITFGMDRPQTLESLRRNILPPRGTPMPMPTPMPNPRFPMPMPMPVPRPMPGPRGPMPMPLPAPDFGLPPRPMPDPGMGPFRPDRFPDQMPRGRQGIMEMAAATVDPSDYRTIIKMIEQGLDPEDYMASSGIMSALPQETQMAELTQGQKDFIRGQGGDQFQSRESLMNKIMTPQGGFDRGPFMGIFGGAQEPTTREELDAFLDSGMVG